MLGLARGTVALAPHDPEWEALAAETIRRLWAIFGAAAVDIQHVGSTAVPAIMAKPILDIAVAVTDVSAIEALSPALEAAGFLRRGWLNENSLTFAVGDYTRPNGIVTHFIHVVGADSEDWRGYLAFRDYLNAHPEAARAYEAQKLRLAAECPFDPGREKYLAGKHGFITETLKAARLDRPL
ncbi:MAG: GrpB family protein [Oscillospiraceae bacterium]|jgi:GrpB-like predicted nucleotidyltransferase (UPF0157 family)|nr:GrpB family protein [Oscillospiraceae bacterium]